MPSELVRDRPDAAQAQLEEALARWPPDKFYLQHWWALLAGIEIALYRNDAAAAWRLVSDRWGQLRSSLFMRIQYIRIESLYHRALAALAVEAQASRTGWTLPQGCGRGRAQDPERESTMGRPSGGSHPGFVGSQNCRPRCRPSVSSDPPRRGSRRQGWGYSQQLADGAVER